MIRGIAFDELEDLLPMASDFHSRFGRGEFNAKSFLATWDALMNHRIGYIAGRFSLGRPVEAIGYVMTAGMLTGDLAAHAIFWMYTGSGGLASGHLYRAVVEHSRELGARRITFQVPASSPRKEKFEAFLQNAGFDHTETLHTIDLWP